MTLAALARALIEPNEANLSVYWPRGRFLIQLLIFGW